MAARGRRVWLVVFYGLIAAQLACSGGDPSSPTPPPTGGSPAPNRPTPPTQVTVSQISHTERTVRIGRVRPDTSSSYIIEVGSNPGATDIATVDTGDNGNFKILERHAARNVVRQSSNESRSHCRPERSFQRGQLQPDRSPGLHRGLVPGIRPVGGGVERVPDKSCTPATNTGMWAGFRRGTTVRVRASDRIDPSRRDVMSQFASLISEVTSGAVAAAFEVTSESLPSARDGENVHAVVPASSPMGPYCGRDNTIACVAYVPFPVAGGIIRASKGFYRDGLLHGPNPFVHEMGHGILGMCHISEQIGREQSVMNGFVGLSELVTIATL